MKLLTAILILLLFSVSVLAQNKRCDAPRLAMIPECDTPKDLHPCETAEDRELGRRFSVHKGAIQFHLAESPSKRMRPLSSLVRLRFYTLPLISPRSQQSKPARKVRKVRKVTRG